MRPRQARRAPHKRRSTQTQRSKQLFDNFHTWGLHLTVNLRVVSTIYSSDNIDTHLLHNKTITDELMVNLALAEMDLIFLARSSFKGSATRWSPSGRRLSRSSSKQWLPCRPPSNCSRPRAEATYLNVLPFTLPRQRHLRHDADEGRRGRFLLHILPGRL